MLDVLLRLLQLLRRSILTGCAVALLATAGALRAAEPAAGDSGLPPVECVRMLRAARLARMAGDVEAQLERLRAAAEAFPDELAATYALLEYHRDHGLPEEEHRRLQARLSRRLEDREHPLPLFVLQQIARDPEVDEALLRALAGNVAARVAASPDAGDELLRMLADLQQRLGQEAEAAATLERLWQRTRSDAVAWRLLPLLHRLGRPSEVLALMEAVTEIRELQWPSYVTALAGAGELDRALAELERRIAAAGEGELAPGAEVAGEVGASWAADHVAPLAESLAWRFYDAGREAEAEALFRRAVAANPDDPALSAVILHLFATDEEERQARAAEVARAWEQTSDPQALLDEGTQRLAAGDAEGALDLLERAAPHFPRLEAPWFNLGMAAYRLERWARAAEALGRAAELNPERAASFFFRGLALVHLERCAEAVVALERALELDPAKTQGHYYLAGCLRTLGRPEEAERHRKLYEAASPGS